MLTEKHFRLKGFKTLLFLKALCSSHSQTAHQHCKAATITLIMGYFCISNETQNPQVQPLLESSSSCLHTGSSPSARHKEQLAFNASG